MTARLYAFATATAVIGLYLLWQAIQLPGGAEVTTLIGPRTWPLGILIIMLALVAVMFVLLFARGAHFFVPGEMSEADADTGTGTDMAADGPVVHPWRHIIVLALTIAYTVAMQFTGYLLATAVFAIAVNIVLGERRPLRIGLTTVAATALVALGFDRLLSIPLP
ncbi:tripartite tricarboxylate transporter TctB family protein [Oceaniglobus indicus]|uniref:tripartite tricarboxylate transporter TctB family protein n=1 Tax=Oceaniglobus indicus TaxID=2047749 RepID=UPI000C19E15F|nr:tripartite tricarboxylate transporter TctB family protein [Oceaniglobus indicus]